MTRPLTDYLLFLAETVTLALVVLVTVAALAATVGAAVRRARHRPRLQVTDLGRRHDRAMWTLRGQLLPRKVFRRDLKADRRRTKAEARQRSTEGTTRPRVFVLDFVGDLRASAVAGLREEITAVLALATDGDEVLLRLENPGGLVNEQGLAASQLARLRSRGIPLTVAVDKVAASGGYMMACVADRILAAPFAVVGSIGVIAQVPNVQRLLDRYGVDVEQFKGGQFKRTVTPYGRTTDADRAKLTEEIEDVHALFKEFVAVNRPQVDLPTVATGEIWYGSRALDLHLVDELTTSDDYLLSLRPRADLFHLRYAAARPTARRLLPRLSRALTPPPVIM
ncbi:MAG TPA: protease SohB [Kineosporiaceae bacterium]|nr:protease SohB [Kineosporiaceae bacterium]